MTPVLEVHGNCYPKRHPWWLALLHIFIQSNPKICHSAFKISSKYLPTSTVLLKLFPAYIYTMDSSELLCFRDIAGEFCVQHQGPSKYIIKGLLFSSWHKPWTKTLSWTVSSQSSSLALTKALVLFPCSKYQIVVIPHKCLIPAAQEIGKIIHLALNAIYFLNLFQLDSLMLYTS